MQQPRSLRPQDLEALSREAELVSRQHEYDRETAANYAALRTGIQEAYGFSDEQMRLVESRAGTSNLGTAADTFYRETEFREDFLRDIQDVHGLSRPAAEQAFANFTRKRERRDAFEAVAMYVSLYIFVGAVLSANVYFKTPMTMGTGSDAGGFAPFTVSANK